MTIYTHIKASTARDATAIKAQVSDALPINATTGAVDEANWVVGTEADLAGLDMLFRVAGRAFYCRI